MIDRHIASFGGAQIERGFCEACGTTAFILDGKLQCCGRYVGKAEEPLQVQYVSETVRKRKALSEKQKIALVYLQEGKCFYCGRLFGTEYYKVKDKNKEVKKTTIHFDHVQPFINGGGNLGNTLAVCNICNHAKAAKVFDTVQDVCDFMKEYMRKNIRFVRSSL
jgi:5-methylcytosine-specific restriction endonuclease McrA